MDHVRVFIFHLHLYIFVVIMLHKWRPQSQYPTSLWRAFRRKPHQTFLTEPFKSESAVRRFRRFQARPSMALARRIGSATLGRSVQWRLLPAETRTEKSPRSGQ